MAKSPEHTTSRHSRLFQRIRRLSKLLGWRRRNERVRDQSSSNAIPTCSSPGTATRATQTTSEEDSNKIASRPAQPLASKPKRPPPAHLTLLGLPRELRDLIFHHLFHGNGLPYLKNQLLGFPLPAHPSHTRLFDILLTSRQIYAEAFPPAYRLSCFYWFRSYTPLMLARLCARLNQKQVAELRHLGFWSNPYLYEDFFEGMNAAGTSPMTMGELGLRLREVTICSNYMSGPLPASALLARAEWILKTMLKVPGLKRFNFLTGCGIMPGSRVAMDRGFAKGLRDLLERRGGAGKSDVVGGILVGVECGTFDVKTLVAKVRILPDVEGVDDEIVECRRMKEVELKIASVYEEGFDVG